MLSVLSAIAVGILALVAGAAAFGVAAYTFEERKATLGISGASAEACWHNQLALGVSLVAPLVLLVATTVAASYISVPGWLTGLAIGGIIGSLIGWRSS